MTVHVVFIEPRFPANQRLFVKALAETGARVSAIGEGSKDSLSDDLKHWLTHYEEVGNVTDAGQVLNAVRTIQRFAQIDRLEAVVEAHIMAAARVREAAGIPENEGVRIWVLFHEVPEGNWGAAGQIVRFEQLREAAKAEREKAGAPA